MRKALLALLALCSTVGVGRAADPIAVNINAAQTGPDIHPFIYGQFIEHLGRCVYGGIWAEMLEDRKFYFPVTAEYDPYKSLQDTNFPVVGASPWQIVGDAGKVTMDSEDSFVGEHTPALGGGAAIQQRDLAVEQGEEYVGYVWAKGPGTLTVSLRKGADEAAAAELGDFQLTDEYTRHEFRFTARADDDKAILRVANSGDNSVRLGTVSLMPADNVKGMRPDTLALLKKLNAPVYRWPGGNFVSGYDWRDGIGDRDRRPPRKNPAWTGVEHNDMGIDEFIAFCREVGAEPMIAANTGFGDAYTAAQEVEYCNGDADTIGGAWRIKNGSAEPFNVKYWCVGNEMFGDWQLGYMALDQYVLKHNWVADAMLDADPDLVLVGVGDLGDGKEDDPHWTEGTLKASADHMDLISEHFYVGRTPWTETGRHDTVEAHVADLVNAIKTKVTGHRELQDKLGLTGDKRVPVAMDEWNYWHRKYEYGELGCNYELQDALGIAAGLHEYYRSTDIIQMAHYAQTVNVIGCIKTTKTDAFLASTALPLIAYRAHYGTTPITVETEADAAKLSVVAALTDDRSALTLGVVNTQKEPQALKLNVAGAKPAATGKAWLVTSDNPEALNTEDQTNLAIEEKGLTSNTEYEAPGYSFTVLRWNLE